MHWLILLKNSFRYRYDNQVGLTTLFWIKKTKDLSLLFYIVFYIKWTSVLFVVPETYIYLDFSSAVLNTSNIFGRFNTY